MVGLAQLVSASGCGPEGRGFESHISPQKKKKAPHGSGDSQERTGFRNTGRKRESPAGQTLEAAERCFLSTTPTPERPGISASPPGAAGIEHRSTRKQSRRTISPRGVAQLVARDVWDVDAAGSNPVTPTKNQPKMRFSAPLSADFMLIICCYPPLRQICLTAETRLAP